jgi:hypothetical protein
VVTIAGDKGLDKVILASVLFVFDPAFELFGSRSLQ